MDYWMLKIAHRYNQMLEIKFLVKSAHIINVIENAWAIPAQNVILLYS